MHADKRANHIVVRRTRYSAQAPRDQTQHNDSRNVCRSCVYLNIVQDVKLEKSGWSRTPDVSVNTCSETSTSHHRCGRTRNVKCRLLHHPCVHARVRGRSRRRQTSALTDRTSDIDMSAGHCLDRRYKTILVDCRCIHCRRLHTGISNNYLEIQFICRLQYVAYRASPVCRRSPTEICIIIGPPT